MPSVSINKRANKPACCIGRVFLSRSPPSAVHNRQHRQKSAAIVRYATFFMRTDGDDARTSRNGLSEVLQDAGARWGWGWFPA